MRRRNFLAVSAATAATLGASAAPWVFAQKGESMYGLIGQMTAVPGKRAELIRILTEGTGTMPGCLSYIVAEDTKDENKIWITEVWDNQASHRASLALPEVKAAIAKGRPLIAGFGEGVVTVPVGGHGLTPSKRS